MIEYTNLRNMSDYLLIKAISTDSVTTPRIYGQIFRSIKVKLIGKYIDDIRYVENKKRNKKIYFQMNYQQLNYD